MLNASIQKGQLLARATLVYTTLKPYLGVINYTEGNNTKGPIILQPHHINSFSTPVKMEKGLSEWRGL